MANSANEIQMKSELPSDGEELFRRMHAVVYENADDMSPRMRNQLATAICDEIVEIFGVGIDDELREPTDDEIYPDPWSMDARTEMNELRTGGQ